MDHNTPAFTLSLNSLDEAIGKLISLRSGGEDPATHDTLSALLRETAWNYSAVTDGLKWKQSIQQLPLQSVCNSLTVSQQSELSMQFSHHVGLSLKNSETVKDFLLSTYAVRERGSCTLYDKERLYLDATNFISRLDFLRHVTFNVTYLANIVLEIRGRYYNLLEWYPMLIARTKLLFHPSSNSNYYRYLANGIIQFRHNNCTLRMITKEKLEKMIAKNPHQYTAQLLLEFHQGRGPRPPYLLAKNTPLSYWRKHFGDDATRIREMMLAKYMEHVTLTTDESIKLAILVKNEKLSKTSPGDFELTLQSIAAAGNLKKFVRTQDTHILPDRSLHPDILNSTMKAEVKARRKRSPFLMIFSTALKLITRLGQQLVRFFQGWSRAVIGSSLGRTVQRVYTSLQGAGKGFTSQLRTQHSVRQILGELGPTQRLLVPFIRSRSLGNVPQRVRQLSFGPGRYSALQLPSPMKKQLGMFSPERLRLKQRALDLYAWGKKNALLAGTTAATFGLAIYGLDMTANDKNNSPENYTNNIHADGPHVLEAVKTWHSIANGTFLYEPTMLTAEEQRQLQIDVFGDHQQGQDGNKTRADIYDSVLNEAYSTEVVNIYDLSLPIELRRSALLKIRNKNQLLRELDSMTFASAKYLQKSPLHKKAMEAAEAFMGILMGSYESLVPSDHFMDTLIRNLIASNDLQAFIDEVDSYLDLVFVQVQDGWAPSVKAQFAHAAEGIQNHFSASDLESLQGYSDPEAKQVFRLLMRKNGRKQIDVFNHQMDLLLSAEAERKYWVQNYNTHRLLYQCPSELPNSQQDYLLTVFWYHLYLAEEGRKEDFDAFKDNMGRLSLIRLYSENLATGLRTDNLKKKISKQDLLTLETSGLAGIAAAPTAIDGATFTNYDDLLDLASSNATLVEFSPEIGDYQDDTDNILTNELVGLNNIKDAEQGSEGRQRMRRDAIMQEAKRQMVKRAADRILRNITSEPSIQQELELFAKDPSRSLLLAQWMQEHQGHLSLTDMLNLENRMQDTSNAAGTSLTELKRLKHQFMASTLAYLKQHQVPGELLALLLEPHEAIQLPADLRAQFQTAHRVLKIKPLQSIVEKQILMELVKANTKTPGTAALTLTGCYVLPFLLLSLISLGLNIHYIYSKCHERNQREIERQTTAESEPLKTL